MKNSYIGSADHIRGLPIWEGMNKKQIGEKCGIDRKSIKGFLDGRESGIDKVEAILNAMGYTLAVVPREEIVRHDKLWMDKRNGRRAVNQFYD